MRYGLAIGLSLVLWGTARVGLADDKQAERLEKSAEVMTDIMRTPEKGIPRDLMDKSVCVGVIPSEIKYHPQIVQISRMRSTAGIHSASAVFPSAYSG
jgi:hypothetical protein